MRSRSLPDESGPANDVLVVLRDERVRRLSSVAALQRSIGDLVSASEASNADDEHDPEGRPSPSSGLHALCVLACRTKGAPGRTRARAATGGALCR